MSKKQSGGGFFDKIKEAIKGSAKDLAESAKQHLKDAAHEAVTQAQSAAKDALEQTHQAVVQGAKDIVKGVGDMAVQGVKDAVKAGQKAGQDAVATIATKAGVGAPVTVSAPVQTVSAPVQTGAGLDPAKLIVDTLSVCYHVNGIPDKNLDEIQLGLLEMSDAGVSFNDNQMTCLLFGAEKLEDRLSKVNGFKRIEDELRKLVKNIKPLGQIGGGKKLSGGLFPIKKKKNKKTVEQSGGSVVSYNDNLNKRLEKLVGGSYGVVYHGGDHTVTKY